MDKIKKINHLIDTLDHDWYIEDAGDGWYYLRCDELGTVIFSFELFVAVENGRLAQDYDCRRAKIALVKSREINQKIVENVCNKLNAILDE